MTAGTAKIVYVGHSTVLVDMDGVKVLTDPVLRPRVVHVDRDNRIVALGADPSAPVPGSDQERSPQAVQA